MVLPLGPLRICALTLLALHPPGHALAQDGSLRLDTGAQASWSVSPEGASPALGIAMPAVIAWERDGLEGPVKIDLSTNYAAFIERWELALFRASDSWQRHPLQRWHGAAAAFDAGVTWDGTVERGPSLRPGETVVARLRVRDVAGNIDEARPQTMLVTRYQMPKQKRMAAAETRARRAAVAAGDPPATQTIPVSGVLVQVVAERLDNAPPISLDGMPMDTRAGSWYLAQVVPAGDYSLRVQSERPIMGGTRLVTVGRLPVSVPRGPAMRAVVKGTGTVERIGSVPPVEGLEPDGMISGRDAARLTPRFADDSVARQALALVDPSQEVSLYRDSRGHRVALVYPVERDIPWGAREEPTPPAEPVKMRARFRVSAPETLYLPHTDVETDGIFVSLRSAGSPPAYLFEGEHFELDPLQGRIFLTWAGRAFVGVQRQQRPGDIVVEVAYRVAPRVAGLETHRPDGDAFDIVGNGSEDAVLFGEAVDQAAPASAIGSAEKDGSGAGWLEWLLGG